jgi:serine/threonine protein kinase
MTGKKIKNVQNKLSEIKNSAGKNRRSKDFEWEIVKIIGKGGHGTVYEVKDHKGASYALKELTKVKSDKSYRRFTDEIQILGHLKNKTGIINIFDSHLPTDPTAADRPFYVMPIGIPVVDFLKGKSHEVLFKTFLKISNALEYLHSNKITHRDIKPANILIINGEPVLSDFGLSNFPKKEKISAPNEIIGPRWTIAPEMQRISSSAEFKKADVYSLAKTLWILITDKAYGFEGQYIPHSSISLDKFVDLVINTSRMAGEWNYFSIVLLERLLIDSTSNDSDKRPTISEFTKRLNYWLESNEDYPERNPYEWEDALKRIFPVGIPEHSEWENIDDILNVLKILTEYDNLNHTFFPIRGGLDLESVEKASEEGCLLIEKNHIGKPSKLIFEKIENLNWSYFRLELAPLKPLTKTTGISEYLYLSDQGNYSLESENGYKDVERYLKGSFVTIFKTSILNDLKGSLDGYSGFHGTVTSVQYREILTKVKHRIDAGNE